MPPYDDDVRDADPALVAEGRRRVRAAAPAITDEQFQQWLADVRRRGGRLELVVDGVRAVYV